MAVNQVSLFFYPPRWKQRLTPSPWARTDERKPVQIADAQADRVAAGVAARGGPDRQALVGIGEAERWSVVLLCLPRLS